MTSIVLVIYALILGLIYKYKVNHYSTRNLSESTVESENSSYSRVSIKDV